MILLDTKKNFEASGIKKPKRFTAKIDGKFFGIMFDKIYENKIKAVIRELSTNCVEAHQMVGKENVPFLVKLPNWLDTNFSIRDYGPGLSPTDVDRIYSVFFESTKDDSNDYGGCMGIGSKSSFCLSSSFIVNSYYQGTKYSYFMIKDNEGCPSYSLANSSPTAEESGLEVIISCKKEDINNFNSNAIEVFRWFKNKPKVIGSNYVEYVEPEPLIAGDGWKYISQNTYGSTNKPVAVMGNIAYDLSSFPNLNKFLINGLILYFDMGEISFTPGRESVSYDKTTIKNIETKLALVQTSVQKEAESKIAKCSNLWEACQAASKLTGIFTLSSILYNGHDVKKEIVFPQGESVKKLDNRRYERTITYIDVRSYGPKCIIDDLPKGGKTRTKQYIKDNHLGYCLWCPQGDDVQKFKDLLKIDDTQIVLTSTLPKITYNRGDRNSHKTKVMLLSKFSRIATYAWNDAEVDIVNDSGFYVEINNNRFKYNNKDYHPQDLYEISTELGLTVYGIKTVYIKKMGKGWKCALTEIKQRLEANLKKDGYVLDLHAKWLTVSGQNRFHCNMKELSKRFTNPNELTILYKELISLEKEDDNNENLRGKLTKFNNFLVSLFPNSGYNTTVDHSLEKILNCMKKKYPLLFSGYYDDAVTSKEIYYYVAYILSNGR